MDSQRLLVYLDVDQELMEISGWHDNRGVQGDDVAFVQIQVEISSQPLTAKNDMQDYSHGTRAMHLRLTTLF